MDRRIIQILNNTACLSKSQMEGYLHHTLEVEELYAVEMHLIECALCNDALEGFKKCQDSTKVINSLLNNIKLPNIKPDHNDESNTSSLSSIKNKIKESTKPVLTNITSQPKPSDPQIINSKQNKNWVKPLAIAASLAIAFSALWVIEYRDNDTDTTLAQNAKIDTSTNNSTSVASTVQSDSSQIRKTEVAIKDTIAKATTSDTLTHSKTIVNNDSADKAEVKPHTENSKEVVTTKTVLPPPDEETTTTSVAARTTTTSKPNNKEQADVTANNTNDKRTQKATETASDNTDDFKKGLKLYNQQQYASAILYMRQAVNDTRNGNHYKAIYYSALSYKEMGDKRKSIRLLKQLTQKNNPLKVAAQKALDSIR